jgi:ABC-2 type transport system ATP-binding protein
MLAIEVEGLKKTYPKGVKALDGLTFSAEEGEVFGLLGPNGAGKSTTVKILVTLSTADAGTALVAGHDVMRDSATVRHSIGYVPQSSGVDIHATGRENLLLQGKVQRVPPGELRRRIDELLATFGIGEYADRIVRTYSGGMKRRLDVALGLVHRPQVLFLDEPTTGLDPEARAAMWEELERLAAMESLTVLLTTHYLEEADKLANRLAIVSRGRIVAEGTPEGLKQTLRGDSVTAELEDGDGRAAEGAEAVRAVAGVLDVSADGHVLRARVENGGRAVPGILSALEARDLAVASVTLSRPSLDDVYLHYTGRDFKTDDTQEPAAA